MLSDHRRSERAMKRAVVALLAGGVALLPAARVDACAGCRNPSMPVARLDAVELAPREVRATAILGGTYLDTLHEAGCADLANCDEVPVQPTYLHHQKLYPAELRAIAEVATADHVRTATAKGLSRGGVITKHILRNSLIPVVTFIGADLGALMGGAIVTEGIFNIQGVGGTVYRAIQLGEGPTVVSFVAVMVIIFMLANLLVDLLYAVLDPRIRYD